MKKMAFVIFVLFLFLVLSGCGEQYPEVSVIIGEHSDEIHIDLGSPYVYRDFDIKTNDGGKDLVLHFLDGSNEDK